MFNPHHPTTFFHLHRYILRNAGLMLYCELQQHDLSKVKFHSLKYELSKNPKD